MVSVMNVSCNGEVVEEDRANDGALTCVMINGNENEISKAEFDVKEESIGVKQVG
jgi:hypothetical protein